MNKSKRNEPISVRLLPDVQQELEKCAEELGLTRNALAQMAIEAAVEAVKEQGYHLVLPLKFTTTHEAVAKCQAPTVKTGQSTSATVYPFPDDQGLKVAGSAPLPPAASDG